MRLSVHPFSTTESLQRRRRRRRRHIKRKFKEAKRQFARPVLIYTEGSIWQLLMHRQKAVVFEGASLTLDENVASQERNLLSGAYVSRSQIDVAYTLALPIARGVDIWHHGISSHHHQKGLSRDHAATKSGVSAST